MKKSLQKISYVLTAVLLFMSVSSRSYGQATTLAAGDLLITSYDATGASTADAFTFVVLKTLGSGTLINFTDRSYTGTIFNAASSTEGTVLLTTNVALAVGAEVKIVNLTATNVATSTSVGTVTVVDGTSGVGYNLSGGGDQIMAFQGSLASSPTMICGLHYYNCTSAGTTDAAWDAASCVSSQVSSVMPPGLTNGINAMWTGTTLNASSQPVVPVAGKFNCTNTPSSVLATIKSAILAKANWTFSPLASIPIPAGCTYFGAAPPVVTADPAASTICANGSTSFSITATGATSYIWQVSTGGAYTNISNTGIYTNATTPTLNLTTVPAGNNGYLYRGVAINSGGADTSLPATLTVTSGAPTIGAQPSDAGICPGGTAIISASATGGTVTYKWQLDNGSGFSNITDGGVYSNSATSALTITGATTTMYGYKYRVVATNVCGSTNSNAATLTLRTSWTGGSGTNWSLAGNWACNVVPDANTDVIINTTANAPIVNANSTAHDISIGAGATLTMGAFTLSVSGDITNLGTFNAVTTGSTVSFNGAVAQSIPSSTYYNLSVSGGVNKTIGGNVTVNNTLAFSGTTKILLGNNTLTHASGGTYSGANASNYIITNGTGSYKRNNVTTQLIWPIGTATDYTPLAITNSGTADNFSARVIDGVYANYTGETPQGSPITSKVVSKTWFLNEDVAGGSNATLIVQWNAADTLIGFTKNRCLISHYVGGAWSPIAGTAAAGANPYTQTRTGITSFSPFGVGSSISALPLKLLSFDGVPENKTVRLNWETADEKDIADFGIERSNDGNSFKNIGNIAANNESGSSSKYQFIDKTTPADQSKLYYRLKIGETDGTSDYSNTITIYQNNKNNASGFQVSPNPVDGAEINIQPTGVQEGNLEISIVDMMGKEWLHNTVSLSNGTKPLPVNVKGIPAGTYLLKLKNGATLETVKIVRH